MLYLCLDTFIVDADDGYADECDLVKNNAKSKWKELPFKPDVKQELYVEYTVRG